MSNQPFDAIAAVYDTTFTETAVGKMQRAIVRAAVGKVLLTQFKDSPDGYKILELNCGTGEDTLWLAAMHQGTILATDIAAQMIAVTQAKIDGAGLAARVSAQVAGFQEIKNISGQDYSLVFSNFGGLNCIPPDALQELSKVLYGKMTDNGLFVAVVMGRFCWWESLYFLLKGKWSTAFRRLGKDPVAAHLDEKTTVPTWYYSPAEFGRLFSNFETIQVEPIGFWLPPSYLDPFFKSKKGFLKELNRLEQVCRGRIWARGSDHFLLVLRPVAHK